MNGFTRTASLFFCPFEEANQDMLERDFQSKLIREIRKELPGCIVLKTDPGYLQGFPDLLILHGDKWAALEVKRSARASHQPNQDYYISKLGKMSLARFVYPENKREVLNDIRQAFGTGGQSCLSESEQ